ncbi:MAG: hypothetical protein U9O85_08890 [Euryarchaeota archaeon]|nr:hypothetical protein [Euryarchaeota archaeon]
MKKILVLAVVGILVLLVSGVAAREVIIDETARVCQDDYYFNTMDLRGGG